MARKFFALVHHESAAGVLLAISATLALIIANSGIHDVYREIFTLPVQVSAGDFIIAKPLLLWVNDGLMALFFLLIGLEIKREMFGGQLSSLSQVALPGFAAVGGIVVPAIIYASLNYSNPVALQGWAIPAATDIAFAVGIFSLFGSRLPPSLKMFLLSVAIFDDIGAIIIIALFYSTDLSVTSLAVGGAGLVVLGILNRLGIQRAGPYLLVGTIVWAAVLKSGVHATLAGFAIAWFIPMHKPAASAAGQPESSGQVREKGLLYRLEHSLHPWVAFLILPVFAFANSGVRVVGLDSGSLFNSVTIGIALGLFLGKQAGIFGICSLLIRSGLLRLPQHATWLQFYGVSLLCGIGFTMSLFIGTLAFEHQGAEWIESVKIGVLAGSLISAIAASVVLLKAGKPRVQVRAVVV